MSSLDKNSATGRMGSECYDDMINLPHHVSKTHPPMSIANRAAQFAPFAALTGYDEAIGETARLTDHKMELDEDHKAILDQKVQVILEEIETHSEVTVTFFQPDERKSGGVYKSVTAPLKKIDEYAHTLIMENGQVLPIEDIYDIEREEISRNITE